MAFAAVGSGERDIADVSMDSNTETRDGEGVIVETEGDANIDDDRSVMFVPDSKEESTSAT